MSKYYFDIELCIKKEHSMKEIVKMLDFEPSKINDANESKNPKAEYSAIKITSKELGHDDVTSVFTKFLNVKVKELKQLKEVKEKFDGILTIYFAPLECDNNFGIDEEAIKIMADLGASWYKD